MNYKESETLEIKSSFTEWKAGAFVVTFFRKKLKQQEKIVFKGSKKTGGYFAESKL